MKKAIVVGASSGLGRGVAEILARQDFQVAITGRRIHLLEECKALYPNKIITSGTTHLKLPITITDVRPGFVDTPNAKGEGRFWQASVEKASKQITSAILQKKDVAYVTKRWWLIAMIMKVMPRFIYNKI